MFSNMHTKQNLSQRELLILNSEMDKKKKSKGIATLLWFFTGGLGGHRYYLGDIGYAVAMTFTLGGCGIWTLIDIFFFLSRTDQINDQTEREIILNYGLGQEK